MHHTLETHLLIYFIKMLLFIFIKAVLLNLLSDTNAYLWSPRRNFMVFYKILCLVATNPKRLGLATGHSCKDNLQICSGNKRTVQVYNDPTHPLQSLFKLLPFGRRLMFTLTKKNGYKRHLFPPLWPSLIRSCLDIDSHDKQCCFCLIYHAF